jgi:hypothetical protein
MVQSQPRSSILKTRQKERAGGVAQVAEHLPSKLSSNPSVTRKNETNQQSCPQGRRGAPRQGQGHAGLSRDTLSGGGRGSARAVRTRPAIWGLRFPGELANCHLTLSCGPGRGPGDSRRGGRLPALHRGQVSTRYLKPAPGSWRAGDSAAACVTRMRSGSE